MIKLKLAKCCAICEYFDHEWEKDGFCRQESNKNRQVNMGLICSKFKQHQKYNKEQELKK